MNEMTVSDFLKLPAAARFDLALSAVDSASSLAARHSEMWHGLRWAVVLLKDRRL